MDRPSTRSTGWRLFVRATLGRAYPRVLGQQRQKWGLFIDVFLPLLALSAYALVCRSIHAPETYIGFVILGGAMTAFWLNVLWAMANQFFWEKESGNLALYIMSPTSLMAILLGMATGGMVATTLRAALIIILGSWMFGVHYVVASVPMLVAVFLLVLVALYGMGMMFSSLFLLLGREAWHMIALAQEPVYLLSGMYFPIGTLNVWVAAGASLIPLTLGLDAIRQLVFATGPSMGFLDVKVEVAVLTVLSVVFLAGARVSLSYMERLAVAEGRLTESRG